MESLEKTNLTRRNPRKKHRVRTDVPYYMLLLPAIVITFFFCYLPMPGIILAFKDYSFKLGIYGSEWAGNGGFEHFITLFKTPGMGQAVWNTFFLNLLGLIVKFPAPIIFALLLNELFFRKFKRVVQTISYMPHFLSWISITGIALTLISTYGPINNFLALLGIDRVKFLDDGDNFIPLYLILTVWQSVGWGSIIFLANISSINGELYEAATLDGANRFQRVWHVTMPALIPTTMILLILDLGQMFGSNFELVWGLRDDSQFNVHVISTLIYQLGMQDGDQEMSTALNFIQSAIALTLTLGANAISKAVSKVSLW